MKRIQSNGGEFTNEVARDIADLRKAAAAAEQELRTLCDLEMGWVAGGDGPVWPI
ncbi:MAG TPA: hypothetical protein VLY46_00075 [Usitatibacter sp.]|nr:hypothetical protein [Usitatibacter sp.]